MYKRVFEAPYIDFSIQTIQVPEKSTKISCTFAIYVSNYGDLGLV